MLLDSPQIQRQKWIESKIIQKRYSMQRICHRATVDIRISDKRDYTKDYSQ